MDRNDYYISGNTVREMGTQPIRREEQQSREEMERIRRKKLRRNAARRNREKAMHMSRGYVAFLSICVILAAVTAASYVQLQSRMTYRIREISALESKINDLKADNDARYRSVTNSVDLEEVRRVAVNKLGMKYPDEEQIVYYTVDKTNFMDQYADIPQE